MENVHAATVLMVYFLSSFIICSVESEYFNLINLTYSAFSLKLISKLSGTLLGPGFEVYTET